MSDQDVLLTYLAHLIFWIWVIYGGGAERLEGSIGAVFLISRFAYNWSAEWIKLFGWLALIGATIVLVTQMAANAERRANAAHTIVRSELAVPEEVQIPAPVLAKPTVATPSPEAGALLARYHALQAIRDTLNPNDPVAVEKYNQAAGEYMRAKAVHDAGKETSASPSPDRPYYEAAHTSPSPPATPHKANVKKPTG